MGQVGDGTAVAGRVNGYVAATTVAIVAVRGSTYAPQTSAAQRSVKSSSASDAAAGTGAQSVLINYLDSNMVLKQDTVTLNGTTAVNTNATDVQFIESIVCVTSGTGLTNAGNIQLMTGLAGAGSVMAQINTGDTQTFYAHHYVPAGVTCYVLKFEGAGTLAVGRSFLHRTGDPRTPGTIPLTQVGDIVVHAAGFEEDHEYKVPLPVVGPDLIICKEFPIAANASNIAYASFDYVQF
jgi:hypothetical protein